MRFTIHIGMIALACLFGSGLSRGETTIDALFQNAIEQVGVVSHRESIKALEEIISKDKKYAPAYNELAKLHLLDHSVNSRQRAMRMVKQAIATAPDNVEYRLTRGKILWHQGFRSRALNQFKDVIEKHPNNTDVLNGLGMFWVYDFLAQKDRRTIHYSRLTGAKKTLDSRSLPRKPNKKLFRSCEKASNWMELTSNPIICWAYSTLKINTGMLSTP